MTEFSPRTRSENLKRLDSEVFDLLIIGGGITGAGTARDAASRGMKVALIEARDFAFGTSSRSSKLIHGGIRYLENKEFKLVFEALAERRLLFELAPHLVHPLRFALPLYKDDRVGPFLMGLGMWLYDALALFDVPEMHQYLRPDASLERIPHLAAEGLRGTFVYSDAYMDDDRLVLETLRSAHNMGAVCANYCAATDAVFENGKVTGAIGRDQIHQKDLRIRARHVVSTVGPWTDRLAHSFFKNWKDILRPSKGVHLILPRTRMPVNDAIVMSTRSDKRIVFVIPRHEMVIIGTTDTDFKGDPADVKTEIQDVDYIVSILNRYFPTAKISHGDFISSYSGVRPLVADDATTESGTSREHIIIRDPRNVTFVAGGKYTTYRHMAEQTVTAALQSLSLEDRVRFGRNDTKKPLNPLASMANIERARLQVERWTRDGLFTPSENRLLAERHGMEAEDIIHEATKIGSRNIWEAEAQFAIQNTMCMELDDFISRRTPLFLTKKDHGLSEAESLGHTFSKLLGWPDKKRDESIQGLQNHIQLELSWMKRSFRSLF